MLAKPLVPAAQARQRLARRLPIGDGDVHGVQPAYAPFLEQTAIPVGILQRVDDDSGPGRIRHFLFPPPPASPARSWPAWRAAAEGASGTSRRSGPGQLMPLPRRTREWAMG